MSSLAASEEISSPPPWARMPKPALAGVENVPTFAPDGLKRATWRPGAPLLVPVLVVVYVIDGQHRKRFYERIGHAPMIRRMTEAASPASRSSVCATSGWYSPSFFASSIARR